MKSKTVVLLMSALLSLSYYIDAFAGTFVQYTYDNLARLIKTDYGNGTVENYTYDGVGNRLQLIASKYTKINFNPSFIQYSIDALAKKAHVD